MTVDCSMNLPGQKWPVKQRFPLHYSVYLLDHQFHDHGQQHRFATLGFNSNGLKRR